MLRLKGLTKSLLKVSGCSNLKKSLQPTPTKVEFDPQSVYKENECGRCDDFDIGSFKVYILRAKKAHARKFWLRPQTCKYE